MHEDNLLLSLEHEPLPVLIIKTASPNMVRVSPSYTATSMLPPLPPPDEDFMVRL